MQRYGRRDKADAMDLFFNHNNHLRASDKWTVVKIGIQYRLLVYYYACVWPKQSKDTYRSIKILRRNATTLIAST